MIKVGIDTIAFYSSHYALDLSVLAKKRNIDCNKFFIGLGQQKMAVPAPGEDIVTMAANAALQALRQTNPDDIEMLLFATESGVDQSKAAGIYVHDLLGLSEQCRVIELKQACYSGTLALQLAIPFIRQHPDKKVLLITSDIARYGLKMPGESSQGCAAVAMILSAAPRLVAFDSEYGVITENVMDFWRPNYSDQSFVDGKYSSRLYLSMLEKSWRQYKQKSGRDFTDHTYYCYHAPVPRLVEKAHQLLAKISGINQLAPEQMAKQIMASLEYGRQIGNSYTASLYLGLAGLLDLSVDDLTNQRVGFYSYGSGCVAEYFSGVIQPEYKKTLDTSFHQAQLAKRKALTYEEYEAFYLFHYPEDGSHFVLPHYHTGKFRLSEIRDHKRIYEKVL